MSLHCGGSGHDPIYECTNTDRLVARSRAEALAKLIPYALRNDDPVLLALSIELAKDLVCALDNLVE